MGSTAGLEARIAMAVDCIGTTGRFMEKIPLMNLLI